MMHLAGVGDIWQDYQCRLRSSRLGACRLRRNATAARGTEQETGMQAPIDEGAQGSVAVRVFPQKRQSSFQARMSGRLKVALSRCPAGTAYLNWRTTSIT